VSVILFTFLLAFHTFSFEKRDFGFATKNKLKKMKNFLSLSPHSFFLILLSSVHVSAGILVWRSIVVCSAAVGFTLAEASYFIIYICTYALRNTFKIRISFLSHFFASSGLLHYVRLINF